MDDLAPSTTGCDLRHDFEHSEQTGRAPARKQGLQGVRIEVRRDAMSAVLIVEPGFLTSAKQSALRDALLKHSGLGVTPQVLAAYDQVLATPPGEGGVIRGVIARGVAAEPGADGLIEWAPDLDPHEAATDDSLASVSFYERSAFVAVEVGQVLGRVVAPGTGEPGVDVRGKQLPARPGRPADLRLDPTVEQRDDGSLVAMTRGVLSSSCGRVAVRNCLVVHRDVDFSSGNIDAPDDVLVRGSVRDLFSVRAGGNLGVLGRIHGAAVQCAGDLHAMGGVAGHGKARLRVGGCLRARYLDQCAAVVEADAHVEREAINCRIDVRGQIHMDHATLLGGCWSVGGRAVFRHLGSPAGKPTVLRIGAVHDCEAFLDRLDALTMQLVALPEPPRDRLAQARATREHLLREIARRRVVHVQVLGQLRPGVVLRTADATYRFEQTITGPITIIEDGEGNLIYRRAGGECGLLGQIAHATLCRGAAA